MVRDQGDPSNDRLGRGTPIPHYRAPIEVPRTWRGWTQEQLFTEHQDAVYERRKAAFFTLLDELTGRDLDADWEALLPKLQDDPRYLKLSSVDLADAARRLYDTYMFYKVGGPSTVKTRAYTRADGQRETGSRTRSERWLAGYAG